MRECPACKERFDMGITTCPRDSHTLSDILVTTYPHPDVALRQQEHLKDRLAEIGKVLKAAALRNDLKELRKGYIELAQHHRLHNQIDQAIIYYHKAELLETGDAETTQLKEIVPLYLQQSKVDKALEITRKIAMLYRDVEDNRSAADYFKHLITQRSADLKWVKEILSILEEAGLAVDEVEESPEVAVESRNENTGLRVVHNIASLPEPFVIDEGQEEEYDDIPFIEELMDATEMKSASLVTDADRIVITEEVKKTTSNNGASPVAFVRSDRGERIDLGAGQFVPGGAVLESRSSSSGEYRPSITNRTTGSNKTITESLKSNFSDLLVMIVDDDAAVRELVGELLNEFGCRVVEAMDGEEAIEKLRDLTPSFIISDIMMPRRDGYGLFEYIQANESLAEIPFIFLTGRGEMDEKLHALEGGVEDYWLKPFDIEEINIRLRRMLQKVRLAGDVRGKLSEMPLPDLLQSLASGNKSGVLHLSRSGRAGTIYIHLGRIVDATFEDLSGKTAIYCLVNWCMGGGNFNFHSQIVDREVVIKQSIQGILMEAMRRRDEENRLIELLPPGDVFMAVNIEDNPDFFSADFSDETTRILQLFDGTHPLKECLQCLQGDLETIQTVVALNKAGLLRIVDFGIQ